MTALGWPFAQTGDPNHIGMKKNLCHPGERHQMTLTGNPPGRNLLTTTPLHGSPAR